MVELMSGDVFRAVKNAQKAGVLELIPSLQGQIAPGERFFESVQKNILKYISLEKLDEVLYNLAPVIHYMADESHWKPEKFTAEEMFCAVKNLQAVGVFEISNLKLKIPEEGSRFFEYYQEILVKKIGPQRLDTLLYTLGQCIKFLACDAAMINVCERRLKK